jgi:hypothetical protein
MTTLLPILCTDSKWDRQLLAASSANLAGGKAKSRMNIATWISDCKHLLYLSFTFISISTESSNDLQSPSVLREEARHTKHAPHLHSHSTRLAAAVSAGQGEGLTTRQHQIPHEAIVRHPQPQQVRAGVQVRVQFGPTLEHHSHWAGQEGGEKSARDCDVTPSTKINEQGAFRVR